VGISSNKFKCLPFRVEVVVDGVENFNILQNELSMIFNSEDDSSLSLGNGLEVVASIHLFPQTLASNVLVAHDMALAKVRKKV